MAAMTALESMQLQFLRKEFGEKITAEEALALAINAEQIKVDCGPFDPAFPRFEEEQRLLELLALLIEKEARSDLEMTEA